MTEQASLLPVDPDPVIAANPVGPVVRSAWGPDGLATASFSDCGVYRYRLSRVWDAHLPRMVWCMLNPSIASHVLVDATVAACIRYARRGGFGSIEVVNLFALRSRDPKVLYRHDDPVGPSNDDAIVAATTGQFTVAGWGANGELRGRGARVRRLLADAGADLHYLRFTKAGHPWHPLYLPDDLEPVRWE